MENSAQVTQGVGASGLFDDGGAVGVSGGEQANGVPELLSEEEAQAKGAEGEAQGDSAEGVSAERTGGSVLSAADFTLPDGVSFDEQGGGEFLEALNDDKLSKKELAQRLLDLYVKRTSAEKVSRETSEKAADDEIRKEIQGWQEACKRDAEFGGAKWQGANAVIDRGCRKVASAGAVAVLKQYGLNWHPEIVRMFYRAGMLAGEDRSGGGAASVPKRDPAEIIFGESLKNWRR